MNPTPDKPLLPGTPLPWTISYGFDLRNGGSGPKRASYVAPADREQIGIKLASPWIEGAWDDDPEAVANAEYIVHACNNYPQSVETIRELVTALEKARRFVRCNNNFTETVRKEALAEIDAALTKASQ